MAAIVAMGLAWGAVAQVRNQVIRPSVEIPTSALAAGSTLQNETPTTPASAVTTGPANSSTSSSSPSTSFGGTLTTQESTTASSPSQASPGSTTSTTQPANNSTSTSTTSTTTAAPVTQTTTYQLTGGVVTISHSPGVVNFVSAIPAAGFDTEIKATGPNEVEVEFESDSHKSEFKAKWEGGVLDISKDEESDDD